jgi:spore maturation protein CgeB
MPVKKILLVGNFSKNPGIYTYATSFFKALKKLNYLVECFNYKNYKFNTPVLGKSLLNFYFLRTVKNYNPDLILVIKGEKISYRTLTKVKKINPESILLNFYPDNPFTFWNGNSNSDVLFSLPLYDSFLIWSHALIPVLYAAGAKKVQYFPFAFDSELFCQKIILSEQDEQVFQSDVCFVGSWDPDRQRWLEGLIQRIPGLNLAIWGNRWRENLPQGSVLHSQLKGCAIYGIAMIKVFRRAKIVLNFIRKQNMGAHNMRTIEVPASKAFLMTERTVDQAEMLFKEGEQIECFASIDELARKIEVYLKNDDKRLKIIQAGYEKVQEYTLEKVLGEFFKKIS